ncbi:hypothetical protein J8273_4959 [Carpediemonas membranifera]|uniref:CCHC-type domain-containing protein n=1 Tax=Carpediemonas membranifera TaxID=201153 RepID=A0A8J6E1H6_9EUKA|nr:hypothetical protein J8273_4959 [Carpediemonas membranifera]|eukprot:KAG9393488.1 hypothetical protein J8273_4959 [Carpediemonas membranifera]
MKKSGAEDLAFQAVVDAIKPQSAILQRQLFQLSVKGVHSGRFTQYLDKFRTRYRIIKPDLAPATIRQMFLNGILDEFLREEVKDAVVGMSLDETFITSLMICKKLEEARLISESYASLHPVSLTHPGSRVKSSRARPGRQERQQARPDQPPLQRQAPEPPHAYNHSSFQPDTRRPDRASKQCQNCGKQGHFARDC